MQVPQIRKESQMAKIGIEQTNSQIEMEQPTANLSIEQPSADMTMQTIKGTLTIDQTQAWEEMNLMSTMRHIEKFAQEGMQAVQEGTGRRAEQGTQLIDIHQNTNMIAEQAVQNGSRPMKQLSVGYIPSPFAVKVHYEPGEVQIDVQENKPIIEATIRKPEITFHRGNVNIFMEQYANLTIDYENIYSVEA